MLCVKEQNEKTRVAAYKCLTAIGYVYLDKSQDKRLAMKSYIEMIIAGVTGQTHLARLDSVSFLAFFSTNILFCLTILIMTFPTDRRIRVKLSNFDII